MKLAKFLSLPPEARHRVRLRPVPRGHYGRRPRRTTDELIAYLKQHNIRSVRQLRRARQGDEPTPYDVIRACGGSWSKAMMLVWGKPSPFTCPNDDPHYVIKCVVSFNLWRRDDYQGAHIRNPHIVPSIFHALKLFGCWENLRWAAEETTMNGCLEHWLRLRRRLGRNPTMTELNNAGIDMAPAKKIFTRLSELNDYLHRLGRLADKKEKERALNISTTLSCQSDASAAGKNNVSDMLPAESHLLSNSEATRG